MLGVVSIAFIVTHVASEWLTRRFGVVTGVEYLILGALVGPVLGLLDARTLTQVSPALVLGQGSLGLLTGVLLNFRARQATSARAIGIGVAISLCTLLMTAALPLAAIGYFVSYETMLSLVPHLLALGAVACVADLNPLRSLISFLDARGSGADLLLRVARACSSVAVIVFGIIFCLFKPASELLVGVDFEAWQSLLFWFGVHLALGGILGVMFTLFLVRDFEDEKLLTVVIGMVIFTSGVAYYLKLSPIFVCFVLGVVLTNLNAQSAQVKQMLLSVERPLYIVLFFFVGAGLAFDVAWWSYLLFIPYLILRLSGRVVGGLLGSRIWKSTRRYPAMGTALWAPGALSAAMLLNFAQVYGDTPYANHVYVGLVVAILASELMAYRYARTWLIDATDVALTPEQARERTGEAKG